MYVATTYKPVEYPTDSTYVAVEMERALWLHSHHVKLPGLEKFIDGLFSPSFLIHAAARSPRSPRSQLEIHILIACNQSVSKVAHTLYELCFHEAFLTLLEAVKNG